MLNIILYVLIVSGVGCFVFLIRKKWSQIQEENSPSIKFSISNIKKAPQKLFLRFKQVIKQCKQLKFKNILSEIRKIKLSIKKFFKKGKVLISGRGEKNHKVSISIKNLGIKAKNRIKIIGNTLEKAVQKIAIGIKKVKILRTHQDKPLFKKQFLEKDEISSDISESKRKENFFSSIILKTKRSIKKVKIKSVVVFLKRIKRRGRTWLRQNFAGRLKIHFISEENQKIKKQLNKTKETITNSESYLGELLKKREEDKIIPKGTENVSFENDVIENLPNKPIEKNIKIANLTRPLKKLKKLMNIKGKAIKIMKDMSDRKIEKRKILEKEKSRKAKEEDRFFTKEKIIEKTKATQERKKSSALPKIEISKEAIKKVENKLISEILEDSKDVEAYKKLGKVYYNQNKYRYAAECFKAAIKLGSGDRKIKDLLKECEEK